jgi:hypothetical protein
MRSFWKTAAIVLALGAAATIPATAQSYDDSYYGGDPAAPPDGYYDDGGYYQGVYGDGSYGADVYDDPYASAYYGEDAYGYCDEYGCPDDYWNLPVYYGPVFYDDFWFNGPLYYRDWGGRRQYWIRGGWRYGGWRGARPSWYREGRYGPALGMNWYRSHNVFRQGWRGDGGRGYRSYRAPTYGAPNRFSTRPENRFQTNRSWNSGRDAGSGFGYRSQPFSGNRNFGNRNWGNRNWGNGERGFRNQFSQRAAPSGVQTPRASGERSFRGGNGGGFGGGRGGGFHGGGRFDGGGRGGGGHHR